MFRFRIGDSFRSSDTDWMKQLVTPVSFLTRENVEWLETLDYVVSPKADGQRMLLLCEQQTFELYLVHPSSSLPPIKLNGKYFGPRLKSAGFLLDAEVVEVGTSRWILAFDVLAMEADMEFDGHRFKAWDQGMGSYDVPCLKERHRLLESLTKVMKVPGLLMKPVKPSNEACKVKERLQTLPYPTDGLVFTPANDHGLRALKWKPKIELTLDVALGGPIETGPTTTRFVAYLMAEIDCDISLPAKTADDVVPPDHVPFCICRLTGSIRMLAPREEFDILAFGLNRQKSWADPPQDCNEGCLCKENSFLDHRGKEAKFAHCPRCGCLGVAFAPSFAFQCQVACMCENTYRGLPRAATVDVPKDLAEMAKHSIVEVYMDEINKDDMALRFKRLRQDKQCANTFQVVEQIRKSILEPIELSTINFWGTEAKPLVMSKRAHKGAYRQASNERCKFAFATLRVHHSQIKGWLYRAFGGKRVIDICAGGLHDLHNWLDAGLDMVLAIERDPDLCDRGRSRLEEFEFTHSDMRVELLEADASTLSASAASLHRDGLPFDSVFCNFAIHYLWETPEQTARLLDSMASALADQGRFVVTYLQGEKLQEDGIKIYNDEGGMEFSAELLDDNGALVKVFVASIGIPHVESVVKLDDMTSRFNDGGFDLVASYPFPIFMNMFPTSLSSQELQMSSLYGVAVFEKRSVKVKSDRPQDAMLPSAFPRDRESSDLERAVLAFLDIPDLMKGRFVCKFWRSAIDEFQVHVPRATKCQYFYKHVVAYNNDDKYTMNAKELSARALACYLRMGGDIATEDEMIRFGTNFEDGSDSESDSDNSRGWYNRYDDFSDGGCFDYGGWY
ncbi:mRNA cap guanine-N7 methyltransferase [Seminavis robusta]|uniref:mRNA cap guanine-N7 methyltransferase n=1 Tax=Seminavis robusta TaxID=568900 RepID=A0A9N8DUZ1_9STRA|nr:mRNA cap guanine-N7 methyltransferase [Seminavis robusta]|eukprot:Sro266_g103280.1 mRNA cap guanine-N7 methyltransferase (846) ;mRNA; f:65610-68147